VLWGDRVKEHPVWRHYHATVDAYCASLEPLGTGIDIIDLPSEGIVGNSHFLMMDRNSHALFTRVASWLDSVTEER
jgi:hypothetical protein